MSWHLSLTFVVLELKINEYSKHRFEFWYAFLGYLNVSFEAVENQSLHLGGVSNKRE